MTTSTERESLMHPYSWLEENQEEEDPEAYAHVSGPIEDDGIDDYLLELEVFTG